MKKVTKKDREDEASVKAMRSCVIQLVTENFGRKIDAKRRREFVRDFDYILKQVAPPKSR